MLDVLTDIGPADRSTPVEPELLFTAMPIGSRSNEILARRRQSRWKKWCHEESNASTTRTHKDLSARRIPHARLSTLCAGCGGLTTLRLMHKVLGGNVVVVNAAGCMTLDGGVPLHAAEVFVAVHDDGERFGRRAGIRDALDILIAKEQTWPRG